MADLTPRYAAFLKKHGRNELTQNIHAQQLPRPRKLDIPATNHVLIATDVEAYAIGGATESEFIESKIKQEYSPYQPATPPSYTTNVRKRPATSDVLRAEDFNRPNSPLKVSRLSHTKFPQVTLESPSVHERLAAFSISQQQAAEKRDGLHDSSTAVYHVADFTQIGKRFQQAFGESPLQQYFEEPPSAAGHKYIGAGVEDSSRVPLSGDALTLRALQQTPVSEPPSIDVQDGEDLPLQVNESLQKQPHANPLTEEALKAEIKNIYSRLTTIEAKCVGFVNQQNAASNGGRQTSLNIVQWRSAFSSHQALLYEHYDFFMATQHSAATDSMRHLANKHSMPRRMWEAGIQNFLELLRRNLPHSLELMLLFVQHSYQMLTLLYETVPAFEDTWMEGLGDLSRYRQGIEEEDQIDKDIWIGVARYWYTKVSDKVPNIGRLHHHLATIAHSQALYQLSLYCKSLSAVQVFENARVSLMGSLFKPVLARSTSAGARPLAVEAWFIRCHGLIFTNTPMDTTKASVDIFLSQLHDHIMRADHKWRLQGAFMAIANITALLAYGLDSSPLRKALIAKLQGPSPPLVETSWNGLPTGHGQSTLKLASSPAWTLTLQTFRKAITSLGNEDVLPHIHVMLVFIWRLTLIPSGSDEIINELPWTAIAQLLNSTTPTDPPPLTIDFSIFPPSNTKAAHPLPEDYLMRGLIWSQDYFPSGWFDNAPPEDERVMEPVSATAIRADRIFRLGVQIATRKGWLAYNSDTNTFSIDDLGASTRAPSRKNTNSMQPAEEGTLADMAILNLV